MGGIRFKREPANDGRPADRKFKIRKYMSRKKRIISNVIQKAAARAAGLESIDPALDLGVGMTLELYQSAIAEARAKQAAYNTLLSWGDEAKNELEAAEAKTANLSDRMLAAAAAKFGRDSNEYEKAGGKRKSDRKRITFRPASPDVAKAA
jgi:hypothetical protein